MIAFLEHGLVRLAVSISRLLILPPPPTTRVCNWEENLGYAHRCIPLVDARWALVCEMGKNFHYSSLTPAEKPLTGFSSCRPHALLASHIGVCVLSIDNFQVIYSSINNDLTIIIILSYQHVIFNSLPIVYWFCPKETCVSTYFCPLMVVLIYFNNWGRV